MMLLLLSIVIAMFVAPLITASDLNPQRGLKRALLGFMGFALIYVLFVRFGYSRLG
jgi:hypothetical protein